LHLLRLNLEERWWPFAVKRLGQRANVALSQTPIIIFDDADLHLAVNGAAFAAFVASGQTCVSGSRFIVQDGIYDMFMELLVKKAESITSRIGSRK
jgi:acyl-CoA reductase-like NAD-dependent aldehyde dehydrogenase